WRARRETSLTAGRRARRTGGAAETRNLFAQRRQLRQQLLVTRLLGRRLLADERDRAARLEHRALDVVERGEALAVGGGGQLGQRDQLLPAVREQDPAAVDQDVGVALDQAVDLLVVVQEAHHQRIDPE